MNKVALITGASRGLGRTLAHFLAGQGTDLILTARGEDALLSVANELAPMRASKGGTIMAIAGDVANAEHRQKLVDAARTLGRLDLLVNNASMLGPSPQPLLADYPLEVLAQVLNVNLIAPLGLIQAALPLLKASSGRVVNISSDAAVGGYEGWGGYGSSKAALDLLSRTMANEMSESGVSIIAVDPGDMRTEMHQQAFPGEDITDRPLPDVTIPFWAWLLGQEPALINGRRFQAQGEQWAAVA